MTGLAALDAWQRDPYPHYERAREAPGLTFVPEALHLRW